MDATMRSWVLGACVAAALVLYVGALTLWVTHHARTCGEAADVGMLRAAETSTNLGGRLALCRRASCRARCVLDLHEDLVTVECDREGCELR